MRKRHYRARVWLDKNEFAQFIRNVERSGLSQEAYLRRLITGYTLKESPPLVYHELIRQLSAIGRNINQITTVANAIHLIDAAEYKENYENLIRLLQGIQKAVEC